MKVLIIVPAYNEQDNIEMTIKDIKSLNKYDFIVVNDASSDNTLSICKQMKAKTLTLNKHSGINKTMQIGFKYAYENGYDAAIQIDADGQHQVKYIPLMIDKLLEGYDMVIGSRFIEYKKDYSLRMIGSRILTKLITVKTGKTIQDPTSGMRLISRELLYDFAYVMQCKIEPDGLVYELLKNKKIAEVSVQMKQRNNGQSIYDNPIHSMIYMLKTTVAIMAQNKGEL